ncbi:MAG: LD-carboxypeptidase [Myxococcales bacterium]|nr:LD-carboxypeptidase [Myxococcales bacterium]
MIAPRPVRQVRLIAPASPFEPGPFEAGRGLLESMGLELAIDPRIHERAGYLAGGDESRAAQLREALSAAGDVLALCVRGGYGTMRLLPGLAASASSGEAMLWGFSDITALLNVLTRRGRRVVHGPVLTQWGRLDAASLAAVEQLLRSGVPMPLRGTPVRGPTAQGTIVGGNLTLLCALLGTPYAADFNGKLLVLEDTNEPAYRIDRLLTQLRLAGVFQRVAGVALGTFDGVARSDWEHLIDELAETLPCPLVVDLPIGHAERNWPLPFGWPARLDGASGLLRFDGGSE